MNILRQYSLPNCTLVLEGLTNSSDPAELRPPLDLVTQVQCSFLGIAQPLVGGRALLENLAKAVNLYAQECLSGVHRPRETGTSEDDRVELKPSEDPAHHQLVWYPPAELHQAPVQLNLSTVQLFDLVEAVDQFMADSQTLPDFSLTLQPVSRRYRQPDEPLAQRAVPAMMGMVSLAIAAFAIYLIPIPTVQKPSDQREQPKSPDAITSPAPSGNTPQPPRP